MRQKQRKISEKDILNVLKRKKPIVKREYSTMKIERDIVKDFFKGYDADEINRKIRKAMELYVREEKLGKV